MVEAAVKHRYREIIAPVDGSEASLNALRQCQRLSPVRVIVLTVTPAAGKVRSAGEEEWSQEQGFQDRVREECEKLTRSGGTDITVLREEGEPFEVIVAVARQHQGDLIVMGRRGLDLPGKAMMGSTTARVIGFSLRDVLVVPRGSQLSFSRMVVGTDGSRYGQRAAARALELAQKYGGELLVTTALDAPQWFIEEYPEVAWPLMEKLEGQVEAVLEGSRRTGIEGQGWVRQGAAYRVITAVAEEQGAGVIIVGSHGRTGMKRLLMGSVTERVIGHATCPVLVVQDPEKGREKR